MAHLIYRGVSYDPQTLPRMDQAKPQVLTYRGSTYTKLSRPKSATSPATEAIKMCYRGSVYWVSTKARDRDAGVDNTKSDMAIAA